MVVLARVDLAASATEAGVVGAAAAVHRAAVSVQVFLAVEAPRPGAIFLSAAERSRGSAAGGRAVEVGGSERRRGGVARGPEAWRDADAGLAWRCRSRAPGGCWRRGKQVVVGRRSWTRELRRRRLTWRRSVEPWSRGAGSEEEAWIDAGGLSSVLDCGNGAQVVVDAAVLEWRPQSAQHGVLVLRLPDLLGVGGSMILRCDMKGVFREGWPSALANPAMR